MTFDFDIWKCVRSIRSIGVKFDIYSSIRLKNKEYNVINLLAVIFINPNGSCLIIADLLLTIKFAIFLVCPHFFASISLFSMVYSLLFWYRRYSLSYRPWCFVSFFLPTKETSGRRSLALFLYQSLKQENSSYFLALDARVLILFMSYSWSSSIQVSLTYW